MLPYFHAYYILALLCQLSNGIKHRQTMYYTTRVQRRDTWNVQLSLLDGSLEVEQAHIHAHLVGKRSIHSNGFPSAFQPSPKKLVLPLDKNILTVDIEYVQNYHDPLDNHLNFTKDLIIFGKTTIKDDSSSSFKHLAMLRSSPLGLFGFINVGQERYIISPSTKSPGNVWVVNYYFHQGNANNSNITDRNSKDIEIMKPSNFTWAAPSEKVVHLNNAIGTNFSDHTPNDPETEKVLNFTQASPFTSRVLHNVLPAKDHNYTDVEIGKPPTPMHVLTSSAEAREPGAGRERRQVQAKVTLELNLYVHESLALYIRSLYSHLGDPVEEYAALYVGAMQALYDTPPVAHIAKVTFQLVRVLVVSDRQVHIDTSLSSSPLVDKILEAFEHYAEGRYVDSDHSMLLYYIPTSSTTSQGTRGRAYVAGICTQEFRFSVVQDEGLFSAYVGAHEVGHNLGMRHDDACAAARSVMASTMRGIPEVDWSVCSARELGECLDGQGCQVGCLLRRDRSQDALEVASSYPAVSKTFDQLCQLLTGDPSSYRKHYVSNFAGEAVAGPEEDTCRAYDDFWCTAAPSADGQPTLIRKYKEDVYLGAQCGDKKWCRGPECVAVPATALQHAQFPDNSSAEWEAWGPWSACSSGCGRGIARRTRDCQAGMCDKRYEAEVTTCFGHNCEGSSISAATKLYEESMYYTKSSGKTTANRACQSLGYGDGEISSIYANFHPDMACSLICRDKEPNANGFFYIHPVGVMPDGEACASDLQSTKSLHVPELPRWDGRCISGFCQPLSCSLIPGHNVVYDYCGVCGGNNTLCTWTNHTQSVTASNQSASYIFPKGTWLGRVTVPDTAVALAETLFKTSFNCIGIRTCAYSWRMVYSNLIENYMSYLALSNNVVPLSEQTIFQFDLSFLTESIDMIFEVLQKRVRRRRICSNQGTWDELTQACHCSFGYDPLRDCAAKCSEPDTCSGGATWSNITCSCTCPAGRMGPNCDWCCQDRMSTAFCEQLRLRGVCGAARDHETKEHHCSLTCGLCSPTPTCSQEMLSPTTPSPTSAQPQPTIPPTPVKPSTNGPDTTSRGVVLSMKLPLVFAISCVWMFCCF